MKTIEKFWILSLTGLTLFAGSPAQSAPPPLGSGKWNRIPTDTVENGREFLGFGAVKEKVNSCYVLKKLTDHNYSGDAVAFSSTALPSLVELGDPTIDRHLLDYMKYELLDCSRIEPSGDNLKPYFYGVSSAKIKPEFQPTTVDASRCERNEVVLRSLFASLILNRTKPVPEAFITELKAVATNPTKRYEEGLSTQALLALGTQCEMSSTAILDFFQAQLVAAKDTVGWKDSRAPKIAMARHLSSLSNCRPPQGARFKESHIGKLPAAELVAMDTRRKAFLEFLRDYTGKYLDYIQDQEIATSLLQALVGLMNPNLRGSLVTALDSYIQIVVLNQSLDLVTGTDLAPLIGYMKSIHKTIGDKEPSAIKSAMLARLDYAVKVSCKRKGLDPSLKGICFP